MSSTALAGSGLAFGISEAARMVSVSAATLRAWERYVLIQPTRTAAAIAASRSTTFTICGGFAIYATWTA